MAQLAKSGPFFAVSTKMPSDEKVLAIPMTQRAAAIGTWTMAGCWSADNLKDGYVPTVVIESQGGTIEGALALVKVRLWKRARGGFQFLKWDSYNFTREQVETKREEERQRKADWRAAKAAKAQANAGGETDVSHGTSVSVPSIPIPIPSPSPSPLSNSASGGTSPKQRASTSDPQPCGRVHDAAKPCRACATAAKEAETEALRVKAEKNRARNAAEKAARDAEKAATLAELEKHPDDGSGYRKTIQAVQAARTKEEA